MDSFQLGRLSLVAGWALDPHVEQPDSPVSSERASCCVRTNEHLPFVAQSSAAGIVLASPAASFPARTLAD